MAHTHSRLFSNYSSNMRDRHGKDLLMKRKGREDAENSKRFSLRAFPAHIFAVMRKQRKDAHRGTFKCDNLS